MRRVLPKFFAIFVMVAISAVIRMRYGNEIRDAIHNLVVNQAMGTRGVDYANHLNPQKYNFRPNAMGELVRVSRKTPSEERAYARAQKLEIKDIDTGPSNDAKSVPSATPVESSVETPRPARVTPAESAPSGSGKRVAQSNRVHPTGAEIRYSPFEKRKNTKNTATNASQATW